MYVTRPLSLYRDSPSSLHMPPPDGPNLGILVIQDQEEDAELKISSRWCGLFKKKESLKLLPFPQNKIFRLTHSVEATEYEYSESVYAMLIPVLNQPLSSNQYYIINSRGGRKGLACTSSKDDETSSKCCYTVPDPPPQLFDPKNEYQQFQINDYIYCGGAIGFVTKAMALDGVPPLRLSRKGWRAYPQPLNNFLKPTEALGLNASLRARLPDLNFPLPCKSSDPVIVGKWYCPFIFIREGNQAVGSQITNSPFYEITLHQNWVEIFRCENNGVAVDNVDAFVEREVVSGETTTEATTRRNVVDGIVWFEPWKVGLSLVIVERMKWEEERGGFQWVEEGEEKKVRVVKKKEGSKVEEMGKKWKRFGCYVLVERFVVKRMDGSLVLTWEFRHTHQVTTKWE